MWGGQGLMLSSLLRQGLLLNLKLTHSANQLASLRGDLLLLCLMLSHALGLHGVPLCLPAFYVGGRDRNPVLHTCVASVVSTEPSSQTKLPYIVNRKFLF